MDLVRSFTGPVVASGDAGLDFDETNDLRMLDLLDGFRLCWGRCDVDDMLSMSDTGRASLGSVWATR